MQNYTKNPDFSIPKIVQETGSMTLLMRQMFSEVRVDVLNHEWEEAWEDEVLTIDLKGQQTLVREVVLYGDSAAFMFARSVIPEDVLVLEPALLDLGELPLGELLFTHSDLTRSPFEFCFKDECISRRSIFSFQGVELLLTETFL